MRRSRFVPARKSMLLRMPSESDAVALRSMLLLVPKEAPLVGRIQSTTGSAVRAFMSYPASSVPRSRRLGICILVFINFVLRDFIGEKLFGADRKESGHSTISSPVPAAHDTTQRRLPGPP